MSRYQFKHLINGEEREISIGWDPPLNTFFAQIHNPKAVKEDEYCELWLGNKDGEFTELDRLLDKLPVKICDELKTHLLSDYYGISDPETIAGLPAGIIKRF